MSQQDSNRVPVTIFGRKYTLKSSEGMPRERILAIVQEVNERMDQLAVQYPHLDFAQIAVMTAMNLTEEKRRVAEEHQISLQEAENKAGTRELEEVKSQLHQLETDYAKLQVEYDKLRTEYNEWIELTEDDLK